ncbi:MAG: S24/S26 family peptidase [Bacteroidaceae bacterium]|nr:S24/S26 family peptidase [Bacteroidaceae bacterium]
MDDIVIIQEAIKLVEEGVSVTLPVRGNSMLPFIIGDQESVVLQKPEQPKVGDVVLAWVDGYRYVIHRIIRVEGEKITLMGDGNLVYGEHCTIDEVKAMVTHVVTADGHTYYLYGWWRRCAVKIWWLLKPFRKYLLAIYRRL